MKLVEITILHKRPGYSENVTFIRTYRCETDPNIDFKDVYFKAFTEAHPDWPIQKIAVRNSE